jgi:hypothetical protein
MMHAVLVVLPMMCWHGAMRCCMRLVLHQELRSLMACRRGLQEG